ncbi:MAG TPA: SRPBCC family protein [Acidimicrobiales bacterium]|jgi:uncharacterized protein YndB with AHSA1/START domain
MTNTQQVEPTVRGSLHLLEAGRGAIRMEEVYDTDIEDLWSAITDPDRLGRWFAIVEGDLRVGGMIFARFISTDEGPGRIDVCEAPHRLKVTMKPGASDEAEIVVVLTSEGEKTRLAIEDRRLTRENLSDYGAGWQVHLEDLASFLAEREQGDWQARWRQLRPVYARLSMEPLGE